MEDLIRLDHDFDVEIATAHSRLSKKWRNKTIKWSQFVKKCLEVTRTPETHVEYMRMSREEQSNIKDVGGFVGGFLANGVRKTGNVLDRSMVTLDLDAASPETWDDFTLNFDCAAVVYSTHKHTPENPRLRIVIPANRKMTPLEYEPVARYWAEKIGITAVDSTTYQLARLFYWPSASQGAEYFFDYQDGPPFDVDEVLASYRDYRDVSEWPISDREGEIVAREISKAGDPTEKPGLIGAFCRAYPIEDAIDIFLGEVYDKTGTEGRYTYHKGSVAGGLVTYDGKFAYSHHETDPASMRLCNAFDLVRIHRFGILDEDSRVEDVTRLPSYIKMQEFVAADSRVRILLTEERRASASDDFAGITVEIPEDDASREEKTDTGWMAKMDYDKRGNAKSTPSTLKAIMLNDKHFKKVKFDLFSQRDTITSPNSPFKGTHADDEVDDASLARMCGYLSEMYGLELSINSLVDKMLKLTAPERSCHAVKDFISREQWDGVPRVDTLLIDYLGAEDTPLTRAMTRKWMAAAVGRAIDIDSETGEGIKFDYCLVLYGEQGTGKSTFAETLANRWRGSISFDDSKKEQYETLQRSWIVEIPEFKGMRSADTDAVKDLITSRSDNFRAAYARQWNKNPRHSVLIGSTNNEHFLKDVSGNRRFWVVGVTGGKGVRHWRDELRANVGQIWAEAHHIYKEGESLTLSDELDALARNRAEKFNEIMGDPLRDYLSEWLEIPLPTDWDTYEPKRRVDYFRHYDPLEPAGSVKRSRVAICEIVTTCPYPGVTKYNPQRIGATLKSLGWMPEKGQKRLPGFKGKDGKNIKATFYLRQESAADDDTPI